MKDMKIPESVQKFIETFCSENREEIIYSSVIHCAGVKEIGRKPYDIYRFVTAFAAVSFSLVTINMCTDGQTIESAQKEFLFADMVEAMSGRIASYHEKVTA